MSSAKTIFSAGRLSLASLNFQADSGLIESWIPPGFQPELHNGECYVSLVCVSLKNVGGRGLPFPICLRLGAIYLRVYVSQETSHGVIRGFRQVRSVVTSQRGRWLLRPLFGNDLKVMKIHQILSGFDGTASEDNPPSAEFSWKTGPEKSISKIKVTGRQRMTLGRRDSKVGFILDHSWLFAEHDGKTVAYEYKRAGHDLERGAGCCPGRYFGVAGNQARQSSGTQTGFGVSRRAEHHYLLRSLYTGRSGQASGRKTTGRQGGQLSLEKSLVTRPRQLLHNPAGQVRRRPLPETIHAMNQ